jgi:hypothetical protein
MFLAGTLDAILELAPIVRELLDHLVGSARRDATCDGPEINALTDVELVQGHRALHVWPTALLHNNIRASVSRYPTGADMIPPIFESVPTWSVDGDLLDVMGSKMPPRDPNDDDDEEEEDDEDENLEPPVVREPDPDE